MKLQTPRTTHRATGMCQHMSAFSDSVERCWSFSAFNQPIIQNPPIFWVPKPQKFPKPMKTHENLPWTVSIATVDPSSLVITEEVHRVMATVHHIQHTWRQSTIAGHFRQHHGLGSAVHSLLLKERCQTGWMICQLG